MQCPFCKETIQEGAIKCRHCGSMLNESPQQQNTTNYSNGTTSNNQNVNATIDSLKVNDNLKKVFHLIAQNQVKQMSAGAPIFNSEDKRLKPFGKIFDKESIFSLWAWAFGPLYYLGTGMWKKGILFLIIWIVFLIILEKLIGPSANAAQWGLGIWCGMMAKYDRYRKLVLNENYWW